ncbi:hypothetical protein D3C80_611980 [compost metagenome]
MTDIPDDIMQAANECVSEFRWNNDNRWHMFVARAILAERERSRQLLSEAEKREKEARAKALEDAALRVDAKANGYQVEARDVRRSDRDRRFCASVADRLRGASADIRALQSEER